MDKRTLTALVEVYIRIAIMKEESEVETAPKRNSVYRSERRWSLAFISQHSHGTERNCLPLDKQKRTMPSRSTYMYLIYIQSEVLVSL